MGLKILIVEDEQRIIDLLARVGGERGHRVVGTTESTLALGLVAKERPDAVVLDLMMPKLDGRDVLKRLKDDPATRDAPVIVMTATLDDYARDLCLSYGAAGYLEKPFDIPRLFESIERYVAERRSGV